MAATAKTAIPGVAGLAGLGPGGRLVALVPGSSATPFVVLDGKTLATENRTSLGIAPRDGFAWSAIAAGPVEDSIMLAAIRTSSGANDVADVRLFRQDAAAAAVLAPVASAPAHALASPLIGAAVADFYGDGAPLLALVCADSTVDGLWITDGAPLLYSAARTTLDPGRTWLSASAGAWLAGGTGNVLDGEVQLLASRAPDDRPSPKHFRAGLLVFARPEHWTLRRASFAGTRAMQEFKTTFNDSDTNVAGLVGPDWSTEEVKDILTSTHTSTFALTICDCKAPKHFNRTNWGCSQMDHYTDFIRFLDATQNFYVDGQQFRVWAGLLPPSEAASPLSDAGCTVPPDSNLTAFNETELFLGASYLNYSIWADLLARVAQQYPHLVALDIDDFSCNIGAAFTGNTVAKITSNLRARAPWMAFTSVVYTTFDAFPDLAYMLDAPACQDSAEDFSRLNALLCTAMGWILIPAYCFAIP